MTTLDPRRLAAAVILALALALPAAAQSPDLPGLSRDSAAFAQSLTKPYPAGGTDTGRRQAEAKAAAAALRNDWTGVAQALEDRLGQGSPSPDLWRQLADAELKRTPRDARRAASAAWQAYQAADEPADKASAMLLTAQALLAQDRPVQAAQALEQAVELVPGNAQYKQMLDDTNRITGLLVRRVTTSEDTDPPRACISFNVPPSRRADFHPEDWVRLDPALPDAAITREGDAICVSNLPLAATTRALLKAGLPAEGGLTLQRDAVAPLAMGNRAPLLVFNSRLTILPHGQAPQITLTSANIAAVKITVSLLTERTMLPWARENDLGKALSPYIASNIQSGNTRIVWTGHADIAGFRANAMLHTALPLPVDAMKAPGLYVIAVTPDDGNDAFNTGAVQPVLQTDLAPTVWRGTDGLTVQIRGYSDAKPRPGVKLRLMAQNNDILAEASTGADGFARFAAPLLRGAGVMAPAAIQGLLDTDFVSLNLEGAAFDLSDRGVTGAKQPGVLDGFIWPDRGIYRPGETVHLMALLRDNAGQTVQRPAHVRVLRPNGQVFVDAVVQPGGGGSLHLPVTLSSGAAAGNWTAEILADPAEPPLADVTFKVDAFVPDRMAVTIGTLPAQLAAGPAVPVPVTARFLYGAPAANLSGSASLTVGFAPQPPAALAGFQVGLVDEAFAPEASHLDLPPTDGQGATTLPLQLRKLPDSTHPLQAALDVEVDDPSGHATHAPAVLPVRPATPLIGIKPLFGDSVDDGAEAGFDIAVADPDGKRIAMPVQLRLVKESPEWRLVANGNLSSYETVWRDQPLETHPMTVPASGVLHFARTLGFGRYRLEVAQAVGLAASSVRFRAGWASSDSPDVPDRADVSSDRQSYAPGATARIHVTAPFAGPATVLVMADRVFSTRLVDVPAGGADLAIPIDPAWGPGAYVTVHVFRGNGDGKRPDRAIGLVWLGVDPAARHLDVSIDTQAIVRPRGTAHATVHTAPGAWVSVAAVDEGILHLTDYKSPDPAPHFLGRRALGVDILDDWGRLIAPAEGTALALRQGGDESAGRRPNIPQQIVSLFQAPVQADAQGAVDVPLPYPDFQGQVRLMAVAWDGAKLGSASTDMLVRDQLVAEPLLPRFMAPGDTARMAVLLQNLDLPAGPVSVRVSADGPVSVQGDPVLAATLDKGAQAVPALMLHGDYTGTAHIKLDVTGPGGFQVQHSVALDVHSVRPPDSAIVAAELPPNQTAALAPPTGDFVRGSWRANAMFGGAVRYDASAMMRALDAYPLFCLEQAASKGFPLALLPDGPVAGPDRAVRLQQMVNTVLDRQRYDGAFALWSATGDAEPWLSAYAVEFLLRARRAGAVVQDAALKDALHYLSDQVATGSDGAEASATAAYALYGLALAGQPRAGAARVMFERLDKLPTPLSRAQLAAALALSNDQPRAERAFAAALASPARQVWMYDYGSAMRDQAAVAVLLKESGLLPDRLTALISRMPGADTKPRALDTQEQAWLAAASGVLGQAGAVTRVSVDNRSLPPAPVVTVALDGAATAKNLGDEAVWQTVSVTGVLAQPPGPARSGMRISRRFFNLDGSTLDLAHLRQNTVFVLLLEGAAEDAQPHNAQVLQGLPAGWEIAGRLAPGAVPGMPWLGTLSDIVATPAADDQFQAVVALTADQPGFRLAVRLRAVTPGNFEIPGAEAADMYRPGVFARQGTNRLDVLPAL